MSRFVIAVPVFLGFVLPVQAQSQDEALPAGALARLGEVRYPNVGRVFSGAFAPDGKSLLAGAWDGSIRLWDTATGKEIRTYPGHSGWVRSVAFAPDGKTFASGGKDKIIRLWETATGKEMRRFEGHQNWIQYLTIAPDGKTLASRSTGQTLRLWDTTSGRPLRQIPLQPYTQATCAFSPDSKYLAYSPDHQSIVLFDLAAGREERRLTGPRSWHPTLAFSPDGAILASVSGTWTVPVRFWNVAHGKELRSLPKKQEGFVWSLVFAPDGRSVVTSEDDRVLHVWEMATRRERCRFLSPDKKPSVLAFSPDGRTLAQGSDDITVLLWDVTGQRGKDRPRSASLTKKELQTLWEQLASEDAAVAFRAIGKWTVAAGNSVPFLREHLRPVAPVDANTISRLVADLDSEQFQTRDHANEQLEKYAELAEPALRRALGGNPPLERRKRIDRLLERLAVERDNPSPERLRMLRAVEALEHMDSPAARRLLEEYAKGAPGTGLTNEASAALKRLPKWRE